MVIGFFDLRLSAIRRFPLEIAEALLKLDADLEFIFIYDQLDEVNESDVSILLPKNSRLVRIISPSLTAIKRTLAGLSLDLLVVMAQRIPDMAIISIAKCLKIYTVMYQHGLYVPFMKRQPGMFVRQIGKTFRYLRYVKAISKSTGCNIYAAMIHFFSRFVLGKRSQFKSLDANQLNVDHVLIYGEYWRNYHSSQYGYSPKQQTIVGSPDFEKYLPKKSETPQFKICYIAQSLVEDGRLPRSMMLAFVKNLSVYCKQLNVSLVVKLHPRSDLSLYHEVEEFAEFSTAEFPVCVAYIGHYSSMLVTSALITDNVFIVDFPNHSVPIYLNKIAKARCDFNDVGLFSQGNKKNLVINVEKVRENKVFLEHYFGPSELKANREVCRFILNMVC